MEKSPLFGAFSPLIIGNAMNILIIGGGLLGRKTAELLDAAGHTVALLDENPDNLSLLSPDFSGVTAQGFPMDVNSLRGAGIEGCDAVAVVTADDNLNITAGQIARDFFHIPKVIARISDPQREGLFQDFGLQTVCPTNMAGDKLVSALTSPLQSRQVTFGTATVSLTAHPVEKRLFGRTTDDLEAPPGSGVFGVVRADGSFRLLEQSGTLPLAEGDSVIYSQKID